jgi:hypothetical protein
VFFIDEAHLLFEEATAALVNQLETIIKLIRSKGVGLIFVTQNPGDIPESILGQLGMKVQHALRAFTANDRKAIKSASENYPESNFYNTSQLLTELGIGEAFVTALNEKGIPTALVQVMMCAPASRMDVLTEGEMAKITKASEIYEYYNEEINRDSAAEILTKKIEEAIQDEEQIETRSDTSSRRQEKSTIEKMMNSSVTRQVGRTVARELTRGLLGMFGIKTSTPRRKKTGWF